MRKSGFYPRLALGNIRKNGRFYLPYLLTGMGTAAMFYIVLFLAGNRGVADMRGSSYLEALLFLGAAVVGIFSVVLLFYTNSFLMKRRRRELGLYNILGMEKRHIARMLLWETLFSAAVGIAGGLAAGILLSKLVLLLLCAILKFDVPFGFEVSGVGILWTAVVFLAIYLLGLLHNLRNLHVSKPIELLHGGSAGDREPKTRWVLAAAGAVCLGAGYAIALTVQSPLSALGLFFIAVLLVIAGTFCLFTAGSIAVLKLLRKNKRYYYRTRHFITVSGMLHRMKRNAAGLASVCILSTMVLVTVSTTASLYLGAEDSVRTQYPYEINFTYSAPDAATLENAEAAVRDTAAAEGVTLQQVETRTWLSFGIQTDGNSFGYARNFDNGGENAYLLVITAETYADMTGRAVSLADGQVLAQALNSAADVPDGFTLLGSGFTVAEQLSDFPREISSTSSTMRTLCLVMTADDYARTAALAAAADENGRSPLEARIGVDIEGDEQAQAAFCTDVFDTLSGQNAAYASLWYSLRSDAEADFYALNGGFFFLGLFLGFLFLMATALIIYYKQVSEGYEDAEGFKIMQQVGMSEKTVRDSIHGQILTVFFLPIAAAAVHIAAAFHMITKMLALFSLTNVRLFALCTLGTLAAFVLIYALVYALTARAYYRIVRA